jgi:hypothetical protein
MQYEVVNCCFDEIRTCRIRKVNCYKCGNRQLFEIYESLPNASLDKMNGVIRSAVNLCTAFYICVGFFGYVAFCTQNFTGNYNNINSNVVLKLDKYQYCFLALRQLSLLSYILTETGFPFYTTGIVCFSTLVISLHQDTG